ncbi:MAG: prepilin-type N-terminal cleavage/methylation domain-containing protein [Pyrinomonadaceae bacterium]
MKRKAQRAKPNTESGFSLLELLVSMVIFLVVTGAIWGLLRTAQQSRSTVTEEVQLAKNVRIALNLISRDAFNAGFGYPAASTVVLPDNRISTALGVPNDFDTSRDTVPPVIAGNNVTLSTFATTANTRTDQVTFLYKDNTFNVVSGVSQPLNINAATTTAGGIDEIVPISGSNSSCRVNDVYIVIGNTGATLGLSTALSGTNKIQFSNGDLLGFNQTGASGPLSSITVPASIQRVRMVTYFVTPDGILTRREYGNITPAVAFVDEPLVYNVENFQIQYVMDSGAISDNPSAGPDGIAGTADDAQSNLAAVRQIRFTVNVRSVEKNSMGQPYRESMTTTVSTRNLGYDAS